MKHPKMKRTLAALTILGAGLIAVACGGDDPVDDSDGISGDGDGGAKYNVDEELEALQEQIDDLEKLLEDTTNADAIDSLNKQIKALQEELAKLTAPGCGKGGDCVGLPAATKALEPVIAAVCGHLEQCCTPSLMKFGLGSDITDAEECTKVLTDRYTRDFRMAPEEVYLELPMGFDLPELGPVAASLEQGRTQLNQDAIDACIDALAELDCSEVNEPSCGENIETTCDGDNFFTGILTEGAICSADSPNECGEGLFCFSTPTSSVCRKDSGIGGPCLDGYGCSEGYCDARSDTCLAYAREGEDCSYEDPKGISYPNMLVQRCDSDLACSLTTKKCVSLCGDGIGLNCREDYHCADGAYCDTSADPIPGYAEYSNYYGACADRVGTGEPCTEDNQCDSGMCDIEVTDVCLAPVTSDSCSDDSECDSDQYCYGASGTCETKLLDNNGCNRDDVCDSGLCTNGVCDSVGDSGDNCYYGSGSTEALLDGSRACPETDYCSYEYGECTPKMALGDDCSDLSAAEIDLACGAANYCDSNGQCAARLSNGAACDASEALESNDDEQRFYDPCKPGSYCKVTDSRVADSGICTNQVAYAGICDPGQASWIQQCKGNTTCTTWRGVSRCEPDYGDEEESFCPIQLGGREVGFKR